MHKQLPWRLIVVLFFSSFLLAACSQQKPDAKTVTGQPIIMSKFLGKWVIINYWAPWCKPCLTEMPELNKFYQAHKDKDAVVLGVSYDPLSPGQIEKFAKKLNVSYPMLQTFPAQVYGLGDISVLPATFIIGPDGKLKKKIFGPVTMAELRQPYLLQLYNDKNKLLASKSQHLFPRQVSELNGVINAVTIPTTHASYATLSVTRGFYNIVTYPIKSRHIVVLLAVPFGEQQLSDIAELTQLKLQLLKKPRAGANLVHLNNFNKRPSAWIRIDMPRDIYDHGSIVANFFILVLIISALLAMIVTWFLLKYSVINRVESICAQIIDISLERKFYRRLKVSGNDEMTSIAQHINTMFGVIENAQELRIKERTQSLHNINQQLKKEITIRKDTEKKLLKKREELDRLAHFDPLTDLPNRLLFNEVLTKALAKAERGYEKLAVIFIDLNRFKHINDALGHHVGDQVLTAVAQRFKSAIRSGDMLARLGGDEFILLLEDVQEPQNVHGFVEKILHVLKQPLAIGEHEFYLGASIGIAIYPEDGDSMEELTRKADMAMYRAKFENTDHICYYSEEMNVQAHKRVRMERKLRGAIANNELIAYFQPQLDIKTNKIIAAEALLRWQHPDRGLVFPDEFIPLAEETNLIIAIGEIVIQQACEARKQLKAQGYPNLRIAVNLSPAQFRDQNLVQRIQQIVSEAGVKPQNLELEITESIAAENIESTIEKLEQLRKAGFNLALDDFGTGYSSLVYLLRFPIHTLKIDKIFIKNIPQDETNTAITHSLIGLAHAMGLSVTAEGVMSEHQLTYLRENNCNKAQGNLIGKAMPFEEFKTLLAETTKNCD